MSVIGELLVQINGDNSGLKDSLKTSTSEVNSFADIVGKRIAGLVTTTAVFGAALKGIQFNAAAQDAEVAFTVMTGSARTAKDTLEDLKTFANNTPMEFRDVRDATQTLLQFGIPANKAVEVVKQLGDVSGGNAQRMQSLALAFGQMSSTGRLMGQDLLQFINAGFNPLNEIAKKTGESMVELKKRMEAGGVSSQEVADAFKKATSQGGAFFGMLEKKAMTLTGAFSTMTDATDVFLGKATEGMSGPLVVTMRTATNSMNSLADTVRGIGDAFYPVVAVVDTIVAGLGLLGKVGTANLTIITSMLGAAAIAATGFGAALGSATMGISLVIGAAVGAISAVIADMDRARKKSEDTAWAMMSNEQRVRESARKALEADRAYKAQLAEESLALDKARTTLTLKDATSLQEKLAAIAKTRTEAEKLESEQRKADEKSAMDFALEQMAMFEQNDVDATNAEVARNAEKDAAILAADQALFDDQDAERAERLEKIKAANADALADTVRGYDIASASATVMGHALSVAGQDGAASMANSIAQGMGAIGKLLTNPADIGAWVSLTTAAIDAVGEAWDKFWGNQTKKEKEAEKARKKKKKEIEQDAKDRLRTEREELEAEFEAEMKHAKKVKAKTADIEKYYNDLFAKMDADAAQKAADDAADRLAEVEKPFIEIGNNIADSLVSALEDGTSQADFTSGIMKMLRKMAIEAAILSSGFADQFKAIGKTISEALADGFSASEVATIRGQIGSVSASAYSAVSGINSLFEGFAGGTDYAPGGIALVGERGPELVNLPRGSQVLTNSETRAAMGGKNITINVQSNAPLDPLQTAWQVKQTMQSLAFQGVA